MEECDALRDRLMAVPARCHLAIGRMLAGDLTAAESAAQAAVTLATGTPRLRGRALATLAHVLLAAGRGAEALPLAREAHDLHEKLRGFGEGDALCHLALALAQLAIGDGAGAREVLDRSQREIREIAATIQDERLRAAWLRDVPENARTLDLASAPA